MPELPEVECVRQGLETLIDKKLEKVQCSAMDLLDADSLPLDNLQGAIFGPPQRKGKYLRLQFDSLHLYAHLGMSGVFRIGEQGIVPRHTHLRFYFADGTELWYTDPRRFGWFCLSLAIDEHKRWIALGPDALSKQWSPEHFNQALSGRTAPIKNLLLDQSIVAGIGNIYASEALFLAMINPQTLGRDLDKGQCTKLFECARSVMQKSLAKRGTTFSDYRLTNGKGGGFQNFLKVFQKEGLPCSKCQTSIVRIAQAGRSTFFCPKCQPKV